VVGAGRRKNDSFWKVVKPSANDFQLFFKVRGLGFREEDHVTSRTWYGLRYVSKTLTQKGWKVRDLGIREEDRGTFQVKADVERYGLRYKSMEEFTGFFRKRTGCNLAQ